MGEPGGEGNCVNIVTSDREEIVGTQLEHLYNTEFRDTLVDVEQRLSV